MAASFLVGVAAAALGGPVDDIPVGIEGAGIVPCRVAAAFRVSWRRGADRAEAGRTGNMRHKFALALLGVAGCAAFAGSPRADDTAAAAFRSEIDGALRALETSTHGLVKWDGADRFEVRPQGDAAIAEFANARLTIEAPGSEPARLSVDHVEIRRTPALDHSIALDISLPGEAVLRAAGGEETRLALQEATATAVIEAPTGRSRELSVRLAGARLDDRKTGGWLRIGPLALSSKLLGAAGGGWTAPIEFELKGVEFFLAEGPVAGAIDRITYHAHTAGPNLAAFNRLRDRLDALRQSEDLPPAERLSAMLGLLPSLPSVFASASGELTIDGMAARAPTGAPLVAFDKASAGGAVTGLSGDAAALRLTLKQDGLTLQPGLLDKDKVPQHVTVDVSLEALDTGVLRSLLENAAKAGPEVSEEARQQATEQMIAAAAKLNPVLRLREVAVDTPAVGVAATGELTGSPLAPKGYTAAVDVTVRGFDALAGLMPGAPLAAFLPVLKEIATNAAGDDGTPRSKFRLASAPPKWLTVNGNDVSAWFIKNDPPGQPRALRPAEPPLAGADVRAVQHALSAANIEAPQSGTYDAATAVAVARFQKQQKLNIDGVVDAATSRKLGLNAGPATSPPSPKRAN